VIPDGPDFRQYPVVSIYKCEVDCNQLKFSLLFWPLHSAGTNQLVVPPVRLSTVGIQASQIATSQIWNSLVPEHIVSAPTLQSFRSHLKTFFTTTIVLPIAL